MLSPRYIASKNTCSYASVDTAYTNSKLGTSQMFNSYKMGKLDGCTYSRILLIVKMNDIQGR
jgi:hypothetical protein